MIYISNSDSKNTGNISVDMIFTDPPFEMSGGDVLRVIDQFKYDHLLLICSAHQALDLYKNSDLDFGFALVIDHKTPTKNMSYQQPHITHSNALYFRRKGVKSAFDRRLIKRHDHYSDNENNCYYPSIFDAPKIDMKYKYQKNQNVINDLVGSFNVQSICDPFAGSGTTGLACLEHKKECYLIEKDKAAYSILKNNLRLFSKVEEF